MKKLLLFVFLSSIFLLGYSQKSNGYYKATTTEMYVRNNSTDKWDLHQRNGNTNIIIVVEKNVITIQALSPTVYKLYSDNSEEIETENLIGARYLAKALKDDEYCTIDVLKDKLIKKYLIDINLGKIFLRYHIEVEN